MRRLSRNFLKVFVVIWAIGLCLVLMTGPAFAGVTQKDFQTIIRTMGFLENAPGPETTFAIVYDPGNAESTLEANQMQEMLEKDPRKAFRSRLVSVSDAAQIQGAQFVFITQGLQAYHQKLSSTMRNYKALSFTLDRSCIQGECCAVYINSQNRVEIVINKAVADAAGAAFKPVFLMMVTVI